MAGQRVEREAQALAELDVAEVGDQTIAIVVVPGPEVGARALRTDRKRLVGIEQSDKFPGRLGRSSGMLRKSSLIG